MNTTRAMSNTPRKRNTSTQTKARKPAGALTAVGAPLVKPVLRVAQELRRWSDTILGVASSAADLSVTVAKARVRDPKKKAAIDKAGALLRRAREAAGLTTQQLGAAIDLSNPELLEAAESGKAALPFEVILRLAGVLGRYDPVTFVMQLTRSYNTDLWKALEDVGVGRLVVQAGREREFANIYRGNDAARRLSDEDFAQVLAFVKAGFEMAVDFRSKSVRKKSAAAATRPETEAES
jgi:transcriptional regulator with XRE-family HTH domain